MPKIRGFYLGLLDLGSPAQAFSRSKIIATLTLEAVWRLPDHQRLARMAFSDAIQCDANRLPAVLTATRRVGHPLKLLSVTLQVHRSACKVGKSFTVIQQGHQLCRG